MTLIEVAAALAVLGTLLVAALMTEVRCRRQSAAAQRRLSACQAAQGLLERWQAGQEPFPRNGSGRLNAQGQWRWRTSVRPNGPLERLGGQQVRLEVFFPDESQEPDRPAATVDVVLPLPANPADQGLHPD